MFDKVQEAVKTFFKKGEKFKDLYEINQDGVIHQKITKNPMKYDTNYIDTYVKLGVTNDEMSYLRYGFMRGVIDDINKILDVGYGSGSFIKICSNQIPNCFGYDISGYPVPEKVTPVEDIYKDEYDVVCFFDVLEHLPDIEVIKNLKTEYIYISAPWCHFYSEKWFMEWKHRKFDEHLWHFSEVSLDKFMARMGYTRISNQVNIEDLIRKTTFDYPNILTSIYERTHN